MSKWGGFLLLLFVACTNTLTPETPHESKIPERGFSRTLTYTIVRPIAGIEIQRDGIRYGAVPASGSARVMVHTTHVCVVCIRGLDANGDVDGAWVCIKSIVDLEDIL